MVWTGLCSLTTLSRESDDQIKVRKSSKESGRMDDRI